MQLHNTQQQQQQQQTICIGYATFNNNFNDRMRTLLIKQHHKQILNQEVWNISDGQFITYNWKQLFSFMKQIECKSFLAWHNYHSQIILNISQPIFINLTSLSLYHSLITNIEAFTFLNMQSLQRIHLSGNLISNLKSLNKTKWNQMNQFYITDKIKQNIQLNRMKLNKNAKSFKFEGNLDIKIVNEDISFMIKYQSNRMYQAQKNKSRINQKKADDCLKRKYAGIKFIQIKENVQLAFPFRIF